MNYSKIYKFKSETIPSKNKLIEFGLDFDSKRKEKIQIEEVSKQLQNHLDGINLN
jgi:hypothetical protein